MKRIVSLLLAVFMLATLVVPLTVSAAGTDVPVTLDPDRTVPTAPALGFEDNMETTGYKAGAVLHHVDFSTVDSLEEAGYYVGKAADETANTLTLTADGLRVQTTASTKVYLAPLGAALPKQIGSYTVQITMRFASAASKYVVFNPGIQVGADGSLSAVNGDIALRCAGQSGYTDGRYIHDAGHLAAGSTAQDGDAVRAAMQGGEWVTVSVVIDNFAVSQVKAVSGDASVTVAGNPARGDRDHTWGIAVGNGPDDVYIQSVTMIAGADPDAEQLWPGEAGENVLVTPVSAVDENGGTSYPEGTVILDPDRTVPAAPDLGYDDSVRVPYVEGAVLHHVDFSTVDSLDELGYFVGTNVTNDNCSIILGEDGLHVQTTQGNRMWLVPSGAAVPKSIAEYTVQITLRFGSDSSRYLVFAPGVKIDADGVCSNTGGDITMRPKDPGAGWDNLTLHDKGSLVTGTPEDRDAVEAAIAAGEWVTISISVYNLGITGMKVQVGDTVITLAGNTSKGQFGANWGLMFGDNPDDTYIKSLTMIAGDNLDAELIWPGEAGENVLAVPQSAIDDGGEENPDETPGGDDSGEVTGSDEETDAPTDPADDDQTAAPTDDATGTGETPAEEEGCASVMPAAAGVAAALLLALPLVHRKKED